MSSRRAGDQTRPVRLATILWACDGWARASYTMLLACLFLVGGTVLFVLGLMGSYVGQVFRQSQGRPLYIVGEKSPSLPPGPEGAANG